jgi:hypothetical protein
VLTGGGSMNYDLDMPPYIQEMADWIDDDTRAHQCAFESGWQSFEIMMALCRSVVEGGQVPPPLTEGAYEIALLRRHLPDKKVLLSMPANAKEYAATA